MRASHQRELELASGVLELLDGEKFVTAHKKEKEFNQYSSYAFWGGDAGYRKADLDRLEMRARIGYSVTFGIVIGRGRPEQLLQKWVMRDYFTASESS